jgi:hypothetical protein
MAKRKMGGKYKGVPHIDVTEEAQGNWLIDSLERHTRDFLERPERESREVLAHKSALRKTRARVTSKLGPKEEWRCGTDLAYRHTEVGDEEETNISEDIRGFTSALREELPKDVVKEAVKQARREDWDSLNALLATYVSHKNLLEKSFDEWEDELFENC